MNIRKIVRSIVAVVLGTSLALGAAAPALADTRDDLTTANEHLRDAITAFLQVENDQSTSAEAVVAAAQTFVDAGNSAAEEFRAVGVADPDATVRGYANDFASETDDLVTATTSLAQALQSGDQSAYQQAVDSFNTAIDAHDKTVDTYTEYIANNPLASGDPLYALWLTVLIVAVVLLVAALLFALLAKRHQGALPAKPGRDGKLRQTTLKGLRRNLVIWAAVFVVGAAIPFVQYWFIVKAGGTYYIFWYPLAAGAILFVISAVQYLVAATRIRKHGSAPTIEETLVAQAAAMQAAADQAAPAPSAAPESPDGAEAPPRVE